MQLSSIAIGFHRIISAIQLMLYEFPLLVENINSLALTLIGDDFHIRTYKELYEIK